MPGGVTRGQPEPGFPIKAAPAPDAGRIRRDASQRWAHTAGNT